MLDNSNELARQINDAGESATTKVTQTLRVLQESAREAIVQSQRVATDSVAQVSETQARLRNESISLFERMREANVLLHEVLNGAHENMAAIEQTLNARVSEFASVVNDVTRRNGEVSGQVGLQIDAFRADTQRALESLSGLATQFDQHGRALMQASDALDASNRRSAETVGARKEALEQLVASLDLKTEDFDQRLQRFMQLLERSLEGAEARAREIGRMVADAATGGARSIAEQFEIVRDTAEQERKHSSEVMQAIYQQSTGEIDGIFRRSTERFSEVLNGMKDMATDMHLQLENTRNELRRGILELPQETAENAAQMRRVIVDQIEALAELNRIVNRHGRNIETAAEPRRAAGEPVLSVVGGRPEAQRPQPRPAEPAAQTGMMPSPPLGMPPAPPPAPRRAEMPAHTQPSMPAHGPAYAPATHAPHAPAPAAPAQRGQSGWLTDLLHRAGGGEEAAPRPAHEPLAQRPRHAPQGAPRPSIDSLDMLSVDIARMVDHDTAVEMWDRYNRGERNAFSRQLYTMHGQRMFEDIRNRYRSDVNFQLTVDRYLGEFERLLEDVSRDDRGGQAMVRTYLTSESGKVYTMLSHAAGRFD
jgi:hypothetical protein